LKVKRKKTANVWGTKKGGRKRRRMKAWESSQTNILKSQDQRTHKHRKAALPARRDSKEGGKNDISGSLSKDAKLGGQGTMEKEEGGRRRPWKKAGNHLPENKADDWK